MRDDAFEEDDHSDLDKHLLKYTNTTAVASVPALNTNIDQDSSGISDNPVEIDPNIVYNDDHAADFFITSRARVRETENNVKKRLDDKRANERKEQKEQVYKLQSDLRKRNVPQSLALRLKKGQMKEVQDELAQKREYVDASERMWREREEQLNQEKLDLYKRIESMRNYERQTLSQYQKYSRRAEDEAKQNIVLHERKEELTKHIESLKEEKNQLEQQLNTVMQYHAYLEGVCKVETSFTEIDKIVERYERLIYANNHLKADIEKSKQETMNVNHRFKKEKEDKQNEIFELNFQLVQTRKELDRIIKERKVIEDNFLVMDRNKTKTERLIGNIEMSIKNLSLRSDITRKYKVGRQVKVEELEPLQQLDMIALRLSDLAYIMKMATSDPTAHKGH